MTDIQTPISIDSLISAHAERARAAQRDAAHREAERLAACLRLLEQHVPLWLGAASPLFTLGTPATTQGSSNLYVEIPVTADRETGRITRRYWHYQAGPEAGYSTELLIGSAKLEMRTGRGSGVPIPVTPEELGAFFAELRDWRVEQDRFARQRAAADAADTLYEIDEPAQLRAAAEALMKAHPDWPGIIRERAEWTLRKIEARQAERAERERRAELRARHAAAWHPFVLYRVTYTEVSRAPDDDAPVVESFYSPHASPGPDGWWTALGYNSTLTRLRPYNLLAVEELVVREPNEAAAGHVCRRVWDAELGTHFNYPPDPCAPWQEPA